MELAIFDTETASLKGGVCDLAIVIVDENLDIIWQAESLIDPEMPISPQAAGIHHITDDMVWDKPTLSEFMEVYSYPFKRPGLIFCGHNVQFDLRVTEAELPENYRKLCTLKLAKNLYPDLPDFKLQTIRYAFKLDAGTAHRAMGDVRVCLAFLRMIASERGVGLTGLLELGRRPLSPDTKLGFGTKHRNDKIKDVPTSYIRWMLGNVEDLDPDLREALEARLAKKAA